MDESIDTVYTHTHQHSLESRERQSNFEILRIICIVLIIMHHYAKYSGFTFVENMSINKLIVQFLTIGGKIGVNIFVIITGYFIINSKFKVKKVLNIILQTFTYTIIFLIINYFINGASFVEVVKSILPITYSQYWFITDYIILYILSPFINKFIKNINKNEMKKLIIILIIIFSILPTFMLAKIECSNIEWFVILYLIGAYINKYYKTKEHSKKVDANIAVISYFMIFMSVIVFDLLSNKIGLFSSKQLYFAKMNSTLALISSVCIFLTFKNIQIRKNKIINRIASTVLGIYMIHENIFMRDIIWKNIFKGGEYVNSNYLIFNAIIAVISVFIISALIEFIRQVTIGKFQNKLIDKLLEKIKRLITANVRHDINNDNIKIS